MKIDKDTALYQCACGEFLFMEVWDDTDFCYFTIQAHPRTLLQKVKAIWAIFRGAKYGISDDVVMKKEDMKELAKFLNGKSN